MGKKYLKKYFRNLGRERTLLLNIFSLAVTLTFSLLILFIIQDELSYDKWNKNLNNVFRVETFVKWPAKSFSRATSTVCTGPTLQSEFPEIKSYVRFLKIRNPKIQIQEEEFNAEKIFFADPSVFEIFPCDFISGSAYQALTNPNSIVISKTLSRKYFNDENSLGKTILVNNLIYTVTGVFDDIPNSHLSFTALLSMLPITEYHQVKDANLESTNFAYCGGEVAYTYFITHKNVDIEQLNAKLPEFYEKYLRIEEGYEYNLVFDPLSKVHYNDNNLESDFPTMNIKHIYVLEILLVIVLIFSCLNYINLILGNSLKMGKHIALKKIFGIRKSQLFALFIYDTLINAIIAILISIILLVLIIPPFNEFFNKSMTMNIFTNKLLLVNIVGLLVLIGIVPGIIVASFFTPIKPFFILKNHHIRRNSSVRKVFIFFEISLLILVVFGIIVVNFQLFNLTSRKLGFNKDNVVIISVQDLELAKKASILKNSLKQYPSVIEVAASDISVGDDYWIASLRVEMENQMKLIDLKRIIVDENFTNLYDLEFIEGRSFEIDKGTDINNCLINEAALKKLGLGSEAINRRVKVSGRDDGVIIGVVKDFYFSSKHNEIEPLMIYLAKEGDYIQSISVKIAPIRIKSTIKLLNEEWNKFSSNSEFNYALLEDKIKASYKSEERLNTVLIWGTVLSFVIVCFGLICFIIFIMEQKIKEIGIRKVNGATTFGIVKNVMIIDLLAPSIISLLIVLPISHYIIKEFLQTMVVEVSISWWVYALTVGIILITLLLSTFFQLYKAANRNPIEALKVE